MSSASQAAFEAIAAERYGIKLPIVSGPGPGTEAALVTFYTLGQISKRTREDDIIRKLLPKGEGRFVLPDVILLNQPSSKPKTTLSDGGNYITSRDKMLAISEPFGPTCGWRQSTKARTLWNNLQDKGRRDRADLLQHLLDSADFQDKVERRRKALNTLKCEKKKKLTGASAASSSGTVGPTGSSSSSTAVAASSGVTFTGVTTERDGGLDASGAPAPAPSTPAAAASGCPSWMEQALGTVVKQMGKVAIAHENAAERQAKTDKQLSELTTAQKNAAKQVGRLASQVVTNTADIATNKKEIATERSRVDEIKEEQATERLRVDEVKEEQASQRKQMTFLAQSIKKYERSQQPGQIPATLCEHQDPPLSPQRGLNLASTFKNAAAKSDTSANPITPYPTGIQGVSSHSHCSEQDTKPPAVTDRSDSKLASALVAKGGATAQSFSTTITTTQDVKGRSVHAASNGYGQGAKLASACLGKDTSNGGISVASASKSTVFIAKDNGTIEPMSFDKVPWAPSQQHNQEVAKETSRSVDGSQAKSSIKFIVKKYVSDHSVNAALRNGTGKTGIANMLDTALDSIPFKYPWACVRGRNCTSLQIEEMKSLHKSGEPFFEKGFTSASAVPYHSPAFRSLMNVFSVRNTHIAILPGSGRLIVGGLGGRQDEWEVLFKSGTKFRVLSFEDTGVDESGRYKIIMKEIME